MDLTLLHPPCHRWVLSGWQGLVEHPFMKFFKLVHAIS